MPTEITTNHLRRLFQINSFPSSDDAMVFLGFRGCVPTEADNHEFRSTHRIDLSEVDYVHPRCTLGQWIPQDERFALYPGSTIPHIRYVRISRERNGLGANQLMTGYYKDYRRGVHKPGSPTAHEAFRQTEGHPIRRTADDFDFDNDDRVEFVNPYDNIHAGWCMGIDHDLYASAGCQVIVGYPRCESRGERLEAGPWRVFKESAYNLEQASFPYALLRGRDLLGVALRGSAAASARLRFGSQGELVTQLQETLRQRGFYEGRVDGDFGNRTLRAVLEYQTATFGANADDGIVGPITASSLGIAWPNV